MQEEHLRVSSENQLQLFAFGQVINDQRTNVESCRQFGMYATVAESAHCGTVASTTTITTNLYGNVGETK